MPILLNTAALAIEGFRSDRLGPLDSIAHPIEPGHYVGEVWRGDAAIGDFAIDVAQGGDGDQIEIDLGAIGKRGKSGQSFRGGPIEKSPVYVVFHCDEGEGGLHVVLRQVGVRDAPYDSRQLQVGDYYIVTPVRPTTLTGTFAAKRKKQSGGAVSIRVVQARPMVEPRASANGATIKAGTDFSPTSTEVVSGDGIVFEVTTADIGIVLAAEPVKPARGPRKVGVRYMGAESPIAVAERRSAR